MLVTEDPVPLFPTKSVMEAGFTVTVKCCPLAHVPPLRAAVATILLLMATEETVGAVVQLPPKTNFEVLTVVTALLNVATRVVGTGFTVPVAGASVTSVGPVLSTVIIELSGETVDGFPSLS